MAGRRVQVMQAAKLQLEMELRELDEHDLEDEVEDPRWRERVRQQLREREQELGATAPVDGAEAGSDAEAQQPADAAGPIVPLDPVREQQLRELEREGTVELETMGTHRIVIQRQPMAPRPIPWSRVSSLLHRAEASESLINRSHTESTAVQGYASALRRMQQEFERSDTWEPGDGPEAANEALLPEGMKPGALQIMAGKRHLHGDGEIAVGKGEQGHSALRPAVW